MVKKRTGEIIGALFRVDERVGCQGPGRVNGLGRSSEPCLERARAVPRSSGQSDGTKRPKALQHYESMNVKKLLFEPEEIILIDDVVTRGSTIMGGVSRLKEAFSNSRIRAFAMMRVISDVEAFVDVKDPCVGTITMHGDHTSREPQILADGRPRVAKLPPAQQL